MQTSAVSSTMTGPGVPFFSADMALEHAAISARNAAQRERSLASGRPHLQRGLRLLLRLRQALDGHPRRLALEVRRLELLGQRLVLLVLTVVKERNPEKGRLQAVNMMTRPGGCRQILGP